MNQTASTGLTLDLEVTTDAALVHARATTPTGDTLERTAPPSQDSTLTLMEAPTTPE